MLTKGAKVLTYIAANTPVYIIAIPISIIKYFNNSTNFSEDEDISVLNKVVQSILENWPLIAICILLIVISLAWMKYLLSRPNNTRIKLSASADATIEAAAFMLPVIITLVLTCFDITGLITAIVIYGITGIVFVLSNQVQTSPMFLLCGYRVIKNDTVYIVTRETVESYNIKIADNVDGVEMRELTKNVFLLNRKQ